MVSVFLSICLFEVVHMERLEGAAGIVTQALYSAQKEKVPFGL